MTRRAGGHRVRSVALIGAATTYPRLPAALGRRGIRVDRIVVIRPRAVPVRSSLRALRRFGRFDTLIVTSRTAAERFLGRPEVRSRLRPDGRPEVLAIGPGTESALRGVGLRPDWTGRGTGSDEVLRHLARRGARRILYPRSAVAGPKLARALRRAGHRVLDLVAYDLAPPRRLGSRALARVRRADRIVVTSPSAVDHLFSAVPRPALGTVGPGRRVIAIGPRTARAARARGLRGVRSAPSAAEQPFSRFLLREMRDVS